MPTQEPMLSGTNAAVSGLPPIKKGRLLPSGVVGAAVQGGIVSDNGQAGAVAGSQANSDRYSLTDAGGYGGGAYGGFGGGAGGGGGFSMDQINQRKDQLIQGVNQRYSDQISDLDRSQKLLETETGQNKDFVARNRDFTIENAQENAANAARSARQNYQDAILSTRRRARATGGAGSSGFMELTTLLDKELQSGLTGINNSAHNMESQARITADKALGDLELSLQKAVAQIESDRATSRREKDDAIREAEFAAADQAIEVQKWASTRARGGGGGGGSSKDAAVAYQRQLTAAYVNDLSRAQSGQLGMTPQQVQQQYAAKFAAAGVNTGQANTYANMTGYMDPNAGLSDEQKFYMQQDAANKRALLGAYDPFTGQINPYASQLYPEYF